MRPRHTRTQHNLILHQITCPSHVMTEQHVNADIHHIQSCLWTESFLTLGLPVMSVDMEKKTLLSVCANTLLESSGIPSPPHILLDYSKKTLVRWSVYSAAFALLMKFDFDRAGRGDLSICQDSFLSLTFNETWHGANPEARANPFEHTASAKTVQD